MIVSIALEVYALARSTSGVGTGWVSSLVIPTIQSDYVLFSRNASFGA